MNIKLNDNVIFVSGAYNAAIYDFNRNKIFSVNKESKEFLLRYIQGEQAKTTEEKAYLLFLRQNGLLGNTNIFPEYNPQPNTENILNFVWLEVTQACNLRCRHCYEGSTHISQINRLSVDKWKKVITELAECGCKNIQFIGGEPACFPDIIQLLDFAKKYEFCSIGFFTNATMISNALLMCFIRNNINVIVSLYGATADIHDCITQVAGSFEKTVNNIKRMLTTGISVTVSITLMRENEDFYEQTVRFVKDLGVKKIKYDLVRKTDGSCKECGLVSRMHLIADKYRLKPKFTISKEKFDNAAWQNTCWYGKFAITENGDVLPCVFERNIIYGNVLETSIKDLLNSEKLSMYWNYDLSKVEECKDCEFRYACKDCRPLGILNGGIKRKNSRCLYSPLTGEWKEFKE